jgi:hypothetical protein
MINLGTNIYNKLSTVHKESVEKDVAQLFKIKERVKLNEYKEKKVGDNGRIKFFIGGVPLKETLADIEVWDLFTKLLKNIFRFSKEDSSEMIELQFWVTSLSKPQPINIFFSVRNEEDVVEKLPLLRDTLMISKVFEEKNIQKGKILIVGYENEEKVWRINYI